MRSKPESDSSLTTGDERPDKPEVGATPPTKAETPAPDDDGADAKADGRARRRAVGDVHIELEMSRTRSLAWVGIGGVIGVLLIWKLGTVGVWGGVLLVAIAAYNAWLLAQTFLYAPGTIIITDNEVNLPRGVCMPRPVKAARKDVTAVYFLRRSVPWNHAAPVLVVELGAEAMAFPRDWFASEAEQRHIVHALLRDKKPAATPTTEPAKPAA
jgi:hypothetical protein